MELVESEKAEQSPLPEPEPRFQPVIPEKNEHGQGWLRLLVAILVGIVLVILIVLLARWIYHKTHHAVQPAPTVSQNTPAESSTNSTASPQPSGSSSSSTTSTPQNTNSSSSSSASTSPPITNTGPGDVAAIFAGTALAAAGLHYIISVRRFSKPAA